ncbi:hypothetical protein J437_LFUL001718 [Ladona fulva]|uniref:Uncharacterized protein n=1 Tax=Ladona fulva TaxID=123851 RepID=A0A8K0K0L2_LADFU|nr:hypothetical protein J437_LFUL001718 [Ladona fulva]
MEQMLLVFKRLDKGESVSAVAKDLGVCKSTIADWKKKWTRNRVVVLSHAMKLTIVFLKNVSHSIPLVS